MSLEWHKGDNKHSKEKMTRPRDKKKFGQCFLNEDQVLQEGVEVY